MKRPLDRAAGGDADHGAVVHEGGVERVGGVVAGGVDRAHALEERVTGRERLGQGNDLDARRRPAEIGRLRHQVTVDEADLTGIEPGERRRAFQGGRSIRRRRPFGERGGLAHQAAQVGVFPLLDPAMRQAALGQEVERRLAQADDAGVARERRLHGRKARDDGLLGRGAHQLQLGCHHATPPRSAAGNRHNRWPRARAPAPCRPSARRGRSPSRARCPARCG